MKHTHDLPVLAALLTVGLVFSSCEREVVAPLDDSLGAANTLAGASASGPATLLVPGSVTVFATGFNNPSGLTFGPDGRLYVAEAGCGGSTNFPGPETGSSDAVIGPSGPYKGGMTGRISSVTPDGVRYTYADNLPSCESSLQSGCRLRGIADVKFIGGTLYALVSGAGRTHGHATIPNGIIRVDGYSGWAVVADLSQHLKTHPAAQLDNYDVEPDGLWHNMVMVNDKVCAVEPNHGELVEVDPVAREVRRIADISASRGHIDPSAVVYRDGYFYVGNLTQSPTDVGRAAIYQISPTGEVSSWAEGFTDIVGMTYDRRGRLYVLEGTPCRGALPVAEGGRLVRVNLGGWRETLVTGLTRPTALAFGPDGALYVANKGIGQAMKGQGEILRIEAGAEDW